MSPDLALLSAGPQCGVIVEKGDCRASERDVVAPITTLRIDRRKIPHGDGYLSVRGKGTVVQRQCEPLIPYAAAFEVFVSCL